MGGPIQVPTAEADELDPAAIGLDHKCGCPWTPSATIVLEIEPSDVELTARQ
jgi:hypothetical protein